MNNCHDYDVTGETQAAILAQALPFMQHYAGKAIVIKYGGHAMGDKELAQAFCKDIALIKQSGAHPVIVHGGGPQIAKMLEKTGIKSEFKGGLRVTDKQTMEVVEMVLAGSINKSIVASMNAQGALAIGLCGKDGNMVLARKVRRTAICPDSNIEKVLDLGFVGEPEKINRTVLDMLIQSGLIPVIAPVSFGEDGNTYNVNADVFAGAIAQALGATRLLFLTDVPGALDKNGALIEKLSIDEAKTLIRNGVISGGMIPKVSTCIEALEKNVDGVVILNGKRPHAVLLELFTKHGVGTLIVK